jgi:hypothetical protein
MTDANGRGSAAQPLNAVDEPFFMVTRPLIAEWRKLKLTALEIAIYLFLGTYAHHKTRRAWPSLQTIADGVGCIERRADVARAIKRLVAKGLLRKQPRRARDGSHISTLYELAEVGGAVSEPANRCSQPGEQVLANSPTEQTNEQTIKERDTPDGVSGARERARPTNPQPTGKRNGGSAERGTRLPADWHPAAADTLRACSEGLDPEEEAGAFRDFWIAEDGPKAIKRDWNAAFRTWCRHSAERHARHGAGARLSTDEDRNRRTREAIYRAASRHR